MVFRKKLIWGERAPLEFGRAKTVKNLARFRTTSESIANISRTDEDIDRRKTALSTKMSSTFDGKK